MYATGHQKSYVPANVLMEFGQTRRPGIRYDAIKQAHRPRANTAVRLDIMVTQPALHLDARHAKRPQVTRTPHPPQVQHPSHRAIYRPEALLAIPLAVAHIHLRAIGNKKTGRCPVFYLE